jgi:D-3-phosphoglycerate dehydrogenase / 2-oxoglutarate reductase
MNKYKTVVTASIIENELIRLREYCDVNITGWVKNGRIFNEDEMIEILQDTDILIVSYENITKKVLQSAKKLKLIGCPRGNPVNIDVKAASDLGTPVIYTPGRNANSAAEFTIGLILAELRHIARAYHSMKAGKYLGEPVKNIYNTPHQNDVMWNIDKDSPYKKFRGYELRGRTLGLIGLGNIGRRVAKFAKAFDMNVIAYDPYCSKEDAKKIMVKIVSLSTLLKSADFVSIHCKVTEETIGLIGDKELSLMKSNAYIINTARASIIKQDALIQVLENKKIAGAALDVYWYEPIPSNHPLLNVENVTLTPHIAGASDDVPIFQSKMIIEDVIRWINGEKPKRIFRF